jgi:hypothetical protein
VLGADQENPVTLTRQDWRGPRAGWRVDDLGYWEVRVAKEAIYKVTLKFSPRADAGRVHLKIGAIEKQAEIAPKATDVVFPDAKLVAGDARLEAWIEVAALTAGVNYVELERK